MENTLPNKSEFVILDTNMIYHLLNLNNDISKANEARQYLNKLANNDNIAIIPSQAWNEVNIKTENTLIGKNKKNSKEFLRNNNHVYSEATEIVKGYKSIISKIPNVYIDECNPTSKTQENAELNRSKHNLRYADSVIYTLAEEHNINNIVTFDYDYTNINNSSMNIYLDQDNYEKYINLNK